MSSLKELKAAQKTAVQQQQVIADLSTLIADIERCEKTINDLQRELAAVNAKFPGQRSTREDIAYLTDLLKCANRKLAWEKQIASLQKRTPALLAEMSRLMNDPQNPPDDPTKVKMLHALQAIQSAMEKLQNVKAA